MAFIPRYDRLSLKNREQDTSDETDLYEMIVHYFNFMNIAQNLFCDNEDKFNRFFEKLYNIDRRALTIFVRRYKADLTRENLRYASQYFATRGYMPEWYI